MGVKADNAQVGQSTTASQNFNLRAPLDGTLRLSRGNAGAELSDPIKINADNTVDFIGNISSGVLGTGQTWQNVFAFRALGTTYTNTTGKPISLVVVAGPCNTTNAQLATIVGSTPMNSAYSGVVGQYLSSQPVIVPVGAAYSVNLSVGTAPLASWMELR